MAIRNFPPTAHHYSANAASYVFRKARLKEEAEVSAKYPIISVTGSSGAGTTSVKRTFEQIFRPRAHLRSLY